jgi:hypothetical protein
MLSGAARKQLADQDAAARRNQLSMAKLREMCESAEFQANKPARAAVLAGSANAVPITFSRKTPETSLEAARARLEAARNTNWEVQEQSRVRARAISNDEREEDNEDWSDFISPYDLAPRNEMQTEDELEDEYDGVPVLAWGSSGKQAGLFTNGDGNLRLVAFLTACPSIITGALFTVCCTIAMLWMYFLLMQPLDEVFTQSAAGVHPAPPSSSSSASAS